MIMRLLFIDCSFITFVFFCETNFNRMLNRYRH